MTPGRTVITEQLAVFDSLMLSAHLAPLGDTPSLHISSAALAALPGRAAGHGYAPCRRWSRLHK